MLLKVHWKDENNVKEGGISTFLEKILGIEDG